MSQELHARLRGILLGVEIRRKTKFTILDTFKNKITGCFHKYDLNLTIFYKDLSLYSLTFIDNDTGLKIGLTYNIHNEGCLLLDIQPIIEDLQGPLPSASQKFEVGFVERDGRRGVNLAARRHQAEKRGPEEPYE